MAPELKTVAMFVKATNDLYFCTNEHTADPIQVKWCTPYHRASIIDHQVLGIKDPTFVHIENAGHSSTSVLTLEAWDEAKTTEGRGKRAATTHNNNYQLPH